MSVAYRMTMQEMQVFSELVSSWEDALFPEMKLTEEEICIAKEGLERKGYIEQTSAGIRLDRVMTGIFRLMMSGKRCRIDESEFGFWHEKMVVMVLKERCSREHYLMLLFRDMKELEDSKYGALLGGDEEWIRYL